MSSISGSLLQEAGNGADCETTETLRPLHYLLELHRARKGGEKTFGIYDISEPLSRKVVVEYIECSGPGANSDLYYTLISDLDFSPKERRLHGRKGPGYTLMFGDEGGWTESIKAILKKESKEVKLDDSLLEEDDEEDESQRELSSPFGMTIDCKVTKMFSLHSDPAEICTRVMEKVLDLKQLVELNLSGCQLPDNLTYTMQFGAAYSLKSLNLDWCKIRRIHPSIGRLRSLKDLSIRYNRISDLPLTIRLLRNLCRLDITGNPFTRLPGAVFHLLGLETLIGLNDCPLMKDVANGWHKENEEISWRKPLSFPQPRDNVDNLKEYCIHAAVGMDCWLLSLPDRYCERLSKLAETLGLCENCLKPVRKLTVEHESQGYTIHAQMAVFCGVRDVPFAFMACSDVCLKQAVKFLIEDNVRKRKQKHLSHLPVCEYELKFVQDLEELRELRTRRLAASTLKKAQGNRPGNRLNHNNRSYCNIQ